MVRHIHGENAEALRISPLPRKALQRGDVDIRRRHRITHLQQGLGNGGAEAAGSTGHDRDLLAHATSSSLKAISMTLRALTSASEMRSSKKCTSSWFIRRLE